ncbi:Diphthamide biosynthesis protein 4 [Pichia californica]|uniref:Diphthamide biosynthesis protein 4 n=1 Tax=Pichia californica TaxID=460514 RepID=A0A9P7BHI3_9ASCO|nr:Diphthamide biosynthesis protein 4 [[Candida] californica]KAG0690064.1 Diphthamide biosynthesis protein 4 [[Candida] californica]
MDSSSQEIDTLPINHISFYDVLGLTKDCTTKDVKSAYHRLLLKHHPDKKIQQKNNNKMINTNPNSIQYLQKAYKTLSVNEEREKYDLNLHNHFIKLGLNTSGSGSNINIDGIDRIDLSEFDIINTEPSTQNYEKEEEDDDEELFVHICPRCCFEDGFVLSGSDLAQGTQDQIDDNIHQDSNTDYQILLQCASCSLWLCVTYSIS